MKNFIALCLFILAAGGWYYYQQYSKATRAAQEYARAVPLLEQQVDAKRKESQAFEALAAMQARIQAKNAEVAGVKARTVELERAMAALRQERQKLVAAHRDQFTGQTLPVLQLVQGRRLENVKIVKVEETGISVMLPSGLIKIPAGDLPEDMRKRLHLP